MIPTYVIHFPRMKDLSALFCYLMVSLAAVLVFLLLTRIQVSFTPQPLSHSTSKCQTRNPMEAQLQFQLWIYMILVSIVLFSVQCSSSNIDNGYDPDTILWFPCSRKYFSESYFEKHDSLLDLDFQGFLAHELPRCNCALLHNCNTVPSLSVLQRRLIGEGSHRYLSTVIKLSVQPADTFEPPAQRCQAVVIERLPSGVFADPFELQHLVQRGVFLGAAVFGDTNLELPSALSNRSIVEVHIDIGQNIFSGSKKALEFNMDLPLHARYPPLTESGYSRVEMGVPDVLMHCITEEESQHNSCWTAMAEIPDSKTSVVWRIPSGNKALSGVVSAVTFLSASLSTLLIVLSAIYSTNVNFTKDSKQS